MHGIKCEFVLGASGHIFHIAKTAPEKKEAIMPKNKNPEGTIKKILDVSLQLFLEKGYDETTVLDIVNNLGGLTRGAFYHHFKSKEEVLEAIFSDVYISNNPMQNADDAKAKNGLERVKLAIKSGMSSSLENSDVGDTTKLALQLMQKPRFLAEQLKNNREIVDMLLPMVTQGMTDGSIKPGNPRLVTELVIHLLNFWLIPDIFPCTMVETFAKADVIKQICEEVLGLHIFDEEIESLFMKTAEMYGWSN